MKWFFKMKYVIEGALNHGLNEPTYSFDISNDLKTFHVINTISKKVVLTHTGADIESHWKESCMDILTCIMFDRAKKLFRKLEENGA